MPAFLDPFDAKQQKKIQAMGTRVTLPEGWSPISEQTSADKLYLIITGEVSVRRKGEEIARLGAGDVMGEKAIVGHTLRTASLVALTPLELLHFTESAVEKLSSKVPAFGEALKAISQSRST
ncbi:MAG: cyclic nucleotide-binding domain-containing protein [Nocardioides sp.]